MKAANVLIFVPNLIGYLRVITLFLALKFGSDAIQSSSQSLAFHALGCYLLSFAGDVVDGYFARLLGQTSTFGGTLDMITDRVATCALISLCSIIYPSNVVIFTSAIILDVGSHWWHTLSAKAHHKSTIITSYSADPPPIYIIQQIVNFYYSIYVLFGFCCVSAELYWVSLFALNFTSITSNSNTNMMVIHTLLASTSVYVFLPGCILKNFINLCQLVLAGYRQAEIDAETYHESSSSSSSRRSTSKSRSKLTVSSMAPLSPEGGVERRSPRLASKSSSGRKER